MEWSATGKGHATGLLSFTGTIFKTHPAILLSKLTAVRFYKIGRLRLRVIQFPMFVEAGAYMDYAAVMLESPHAQLYQLYRAKAEGFVRLVMRFEIAVYAFRLKLREGQIMPFTRKIADMLL